MPSRLRARGVGNDPERSFVANLFGVDIDVSSTLEVSRSEIIDADTHDRFVYRLSG